MSSAGAAPRAAVPVSNARAEASRAERREVARAEDRGRQGALGAECAQARHARGEASRAARTRTPRSSPALEAALVEELAPVGALQTVLARRVAVAAWRLARADRIEAELFEERRARRRARARPDPGWQRRALVRDAAALSRRGDGRVLARAAHAQGAPGRAGARDRCKRCAGARAPAAARPRARPTRATERTRARPGPTAISPGAPPASGALHEPAVPWLPNEPESAPIGAVLT